MHEKGQEIHLKDQYRILLYHLMIGSLDKDDKNFRDTILFESIDIQTWIYLKLSSCHEEAEQDSTPAWYKGYSLSLFR